MSTHATPPAAHRSVTSIRGGAQLPATSSSPHTPPRTIVPVFGSPSTLRAEEDVIVLEIGSRFVRVGFAGDNAPRVQLQLPPEQQRRVGDHRRWASGYKDEWTRRPAGEDWGADYELWRHDLRSVDLGLVKDKLDRLLREAFSKHLLIDSKPRRVALVIPSLLPLPLLSTTLDLLFTSFQSPLVSLFSSANMATAAAGLRSSLVVDLGWAETVVTSVYEYREVRCTRSVRGGRHLVSSLHGILEEALREKGITPQEEEGQGQDNRHVVSFGECEEICTRVVWCKPAEKPAAEEPETGLSTVQEQDESEAEAPSSATRDNKTITIPLQSTEPPTNLDLPFSRLADACENTYFEERAGAPNTFDDEELPAHWLVYLHLLRLPLDVRAICMSRIIFTGGCSRIIGVKGRIFDELAALVRERGWNAVTGRGAEALKNNAKLRRRGSMQAAAGPTQATAAAAAAGGEGEKRDDDDGGVWHDAANEPQESNFIDERLEGRKLAEQQLQGQLRAVESLGPWSGASLTCHLKVLAMAVVERENWIQQGAAGASKPGEVDIKVQQRQSLGAGGLMRGATTGQDRAWTLGMWGTS